MAFSCPRCRRVRSSPCGPVCHLSGTSDHYAEIRRQAAAAVERKAKAEKYIQERIESAERAERAERSQEAD